MIEFQVQMEKSCLLDKSVLFTLVCLSVKKNFLMNVQFMASIELIELKGS